jgi:archaellum component FlaC
MYNKERLEQPIQEIRESVQRMKEVLFKRCEDRVSKLAADIVDLEKKTRHGIVEVSNNIQNVEKMKC